MMQEKRIALLSDLVSHDRVALATMAPVLSDMGAQVFQIPTALVSNTLNYGRYEILDTSDYLTNTLKVWKELGFEFEALFTGFLLNNRQAGEITDYLKGKEKLLYFLDPILGDEGKLYHGIGMDRVEVVKGLIPYADYIMPNLTEAQLLTGLAGSEPKRLCGALAGMGAKAIVITSVKGKEGFAVACYNAGEKEYLEIPYEELEGRFFGTGDLFDAVFIGKILQGLDLFTAAEYATCKLSYAIRQKLAAKEEGRCLNIEGIEW